MGCTSRIAESTKLNVVQNSTNMNNPWEAYPTAKEFIAELKQYLQRTPSFASALLPVVNGLFSDAIEDIV